MNPRADAGSDVGAGIIGSRRKYFLNVLRAIGAMAEIVGSRISRPLGARLAARLAAIGAAAASPMLPFVGVPLALGIAGYLAITLSRPDNVLRGRRLSAAQHRRAAIIVGGGIFGIAALASATLAGLDLAARLEARLHDRIEIAAGEGTLRPGQTLRECERPACARATIVTLASDRTLGVAALRGFIRHDVRAFGRRRPASRSNGDGQDSDGPGKSLRVQ